MNIKCCIVLLQASTTDNNALSIDAIYNLKLNLIQQTVLLYTKLNAKFPWPPIMPKQRKCILHRYFILIIND
jgi:hypothetical protein